MLSNIRTSISFSKQLYKSPKHQMGWYKLPFRSANATSANSSINISESFTADSITTQSSESKSKYYRQFRDYTKLRYIASLLIAGYALYEFNPYQTKIRLMFQQNEFNNQLVPSLSHLYDQYFYPCLYLALPILQFIGLGFGSGPAFAYQREEVILSDGGSIMLDWAMPKRFQAGSSNFFTASNSVYEHYEAPQDNKILFMLHGLTGGSEAKYMRVVVDEAVNQGYRVVIMNQRGVGHPLKNIKPYHSGRYDDIDEAFKYISEKYPEAPIVAAGFSMGGNQMIRYLGNKGENTKIQAFVSIAPPFDVNDCIESIKGSIYERFLLSGYIKNNFVPHFDFLEKNLLELHNILAKDVLSVKSLRDYHSKYTVPVYGHKDVDEFFNTTKIQDWHIQQIQVPSLLLRARDDPISVHKNVPFEAIKENPKVIYAETSRGSHLCWIAGWLPKPVSKD